MNKDQISSIFTKINDLMEVRRKADELMEKIVFSIALEHLKQNGVGQTIEERDYTVAALKMLVGITKKFQPRQMFLSKRMWPTHIRIFDLKPVRIEEMQELSKTYKVKEIRGQLLETINFDQLNSDFIKIRKEENE